MFPIMDVLSAVIAGIKSLFHSGMWLIRAIPSLLFSVSSVYAYAPEFLQYLLITCASLTVAFAVIKIIF